MLGWLWDLLSYLLEVLGLVERQVEEEQGVRVTVKAVSGQSLSLTLLEGWTVWDVKGHLAPQLAAQPEEIRIIFAGKELRDGVSLDSCQLGNQSVLHAVTVLRREREVGLVGTEVRCLSDDEEGEGEGGGAEPLAATLVDLQLEGAARVAGGSPAHFYTWCSVQDSISPAKLRVRCGACGEGAVVLHQDPACWRDVLAPVLTCSCAACHLDPAPAAFYFRCGCGRHQGSDTAVPLYLVKTNLVSVPCLACTGVESPVVVWGCEEGHVTCVQCFIDYCRSRLSERQFLLDPEAGYTLPCPVGCQDSLITEPSHFRLLGSSLYSRYSRFGAEELVLQAGGVLCPQPGCGAGILPQEGGQCRRIGCSDCGFVFCRDCLQGAHLGDCLAECGPGGEEAEYTSMDPADPRASRARWTGADPSSVTIRALTKPCPRCRTPTERSGGCMHMICTKAGCGLHWCWVCQVEWTRECMANHWFG